MHNAGVEKPVRLQNSNHSEMTGPCPKTGETFTLSPGPTVADFQHGSWTFDCPACGERHEHTFTRSDSPPT